MTFELDTPHGRMPGWGREAPKSVGSNGETVFRVKGERAFEVDVWTFNRRCLGGKSVIVEKPLRLRRRLAEMGQALATHHGSRG